MFKLFTVICLFLFGAAVSASGDSSAQISRTAYLDQATAGVRQINAHNLCRLLNETASGAVLLDVRTFYERGQGNTIRGDSEIHIPRGFLEIKAWNALPRNQEIVVYCSKGLRSKLAAKTLMEMGWDAVSSLEGGIEAWYALENENCSCRPETPGTAIERFKPGAAGTRERLN